MSSRPPQDSCPYNRHRAHFARRDLIYYQNNSVRNSDAFIITCRISSSPTPVPIETTPTAYRSVPTKLVKVIGSLLDDPVYSDVEFVLCQRARKSEQRSILASSKILRRFDYFESSERSVIY